MCARARWTACRPTCPAAAASPSGCGWPRSPPPTAWRSPGTARPHLHAHVAAATPNLRHLEWFHDHVRIESMFFDGTLDPAGGVIRPDPDAPGHGLTLRRADAEAYRWPWRVRTQDGEPVAVAGRLAGRAGRSGPDEPPRSPVPHAAFLRRRAPRPGPPRPGPGRRLRAQAGPLSQGEAHRLRVGVRLPDIYAVAPEHLVPDPADAPAEPPDRSRAGHRRLRR